MTNKVIDGVVLGLCIALAAQDSYQETQHCWGIHVADCLLL